MRVWMRVYVGEHVYMCRHGMCIPQGKDRSKNKSTQILHIWTILKAKSYYVHMAEPIASFRYSEEVVHVRDMSSVLLLEPCVGSV